MKLKRKVYENHKQKVIDLFLGILLFLVVTILAGVAGSVSINNSYKPVINNILISLSSFGFLIDISAIIFFAFTRHWIALGMLFAFGFILFIILCLGIILSVVCFASLSQMNWMIGMSNSAFA